MTTDADTETPLTFQTPAVRHLAGLCCAPQLLEAPMSYYPPQWLPDDYLERLQHWDQQPEAMPTRLAQPAERRLGHYYERLSEVLLQVLLGWELLLTN